MMTEECQEQRKKGKEKRELREIERNAHCMEERRDSYFETTKLEKEEARYCILNSCVELKI